MKYLWSIAIALSFFLASLAIAGTSATAQNQTQSQEKIYKPDEVTVRARVTRKVEPLYTEEARRHRTSGTIVAEMVLRASGEVTDIVIIKGLPHGLNDSAVRAAKATQFEPAIKDDQKVSQYARMEFGFRVY